MDQKAIKELSKLCRIECTPEEEAHFLKDLQSILNYFEQLREVNTEGVRPLDHVLESVVNVMREDTIEHLLPREKFLENAPSQIGGMIKVPTVMKGG